MVQARNVFDNDEEFMRLRSAVMSAISEFSESRDGNVTYGEIMFVLESLVDELRTRCEDHAPSDEDVLLEKMTRVSQVRGVLGKALSLLVEKGILSEDELRLLAGAK